MTDLLQLMKERQSSRTPFDPKAPVSRQDLQQILEAGSWAPTAHNMQNFEALVVDDNKILKQISEIEFPVSKSFIQENYLQLSFSEEELQRKKTGVLATMFPKSWLKPNQIPLKIQNENTDSQTERHHQLLSCTALIILLYDPAKRAPASEGDFLGIMSIGCVLENMWLMAASLGIGLHVVSALSAEEPEMKIKKMLDIPDFLKIAISFRLGYPIFSPKYLRVRREIGGFAHINHYGKLGLAD